MHFIAMLLLKTYLSMGVFVLLAITAPLAQLYQQHVPLVHSMGKSALNR
jgi:hypothetical protein